MKLPATPPPFVFTPAPSELAFRFADGAQARSLRELADRLPQASTDTVWYHREHIVPWIWHVVGDEPLARRVESYARSGGDPALFHETLRDLVAHRLDQLGAKPSV